LRISPQSAGVDSARVAIGLRERSRQDRDFAPTFPVDPIVLGEQRIEPAAVSIKRHRRACVTNEPLDQASLVLKRALRRLKLRAQEHFEKPLRQLTHMTKNLRGGVIGRQYSPTASLANIVQRRRDFYSMADCLDSDGCD